MVTVLVELEFFEVDINKDLISSQVHFVSVTMGVAVSIEHITITSRLQYNVVLT